MTWTWAGGVQGFGTAHGPAEDVERAVAALTAALPGGGAEGMARALGSGAMSAYESERGLANTLAEALWPPQLTEQLHQVRSRSSQRPLIRIQPSPRTAQVPWELLALADTTGQADAAEDVRLMDLADVVTTAPASSRRPGTTTDRTATSDRVVLVLDPKVPGFRADSPLGSVLGRPGSDPELLKLIERRLEAGTVAPEVTTPAEALRRTDLDREWLGTVLREGARRLLYVGHVSGAPVENGQSEDVTLHLCCDAQTTGLAEPVRGHRPLAAKDLFLGTLPLRADGEPGSSLWPAPPRVALIGCESGGDLRFAESFGLASAMIHNGADLVTATRWVLPTSFAFHRLAGVPQTVRPLTEAVTAVDTAHESDNPVTELTTWQQSQLTKWRTTGNPSHSPLLWASLTCIVR
ncbi:CHAT domain-containing protein [Streptomyces griseoviridis]